MVTNTLSYTMRTNINIAIVSMVDNKDKVDSIEQAITPCWLSNSTDCNLESLTNYTAYAYRLLTSTATSSSSPATTLSPVSPKSGAQTFEWSESIQGVVLGAYYYCYLFTNWYAGQLAQIFGTRKLVALSLLAAGLFTLLTPLCAFTNVYLVVGCRIIIGIFQGLFSPSLYTMLPHWIPKHEQGIAFSLTQASGLLGIVITNPICAFLSEHGFAGGWPSIFYVFGSIGVLSVIPWIYFVHDSPNTHPRIQDDELLYIKENCPMSNTSKTSDSKNDSSVPWRLILTSRKVWLIAVTKFCSSWGNMFLMTKLPSYVESRLNLPIEANGYINSSLYIMNGGSNIFFGFVSDLIERRQWINRTTSRKMFQSTAMFGAAIFLAIVPTVGSNTALIIVMINLSMVMVGMVAGGEYLVVVDVAPDYSGSIYGFTNAVASVPGFLAPLFVGFMLDMKNVNIEAQWKLLFWIGSGIYLFGGLIFIFGVNSNPEKWGFKPMSNESNNSSDAKQAMGDEEATCRRRQDEVKRDRDESLTMTTTEKTNAADIA